MPKNRYRYLEEIATADAAFEAFGDTLPDLFENAALAMFNVMVPLEKLGHNSIRDVTITAETEEDLLFGWLAELIYLKDVHGELYSYFTVKITRAEDMTLAAEIRGDTIDTVREHTHTDVKAVTYHQLKIEHDDEGFKATVVLDL